MPPQQTTLQQKADLRQAMAKQRRALRPEVVAACSAQLCQQILDQPVYQSASWVAVYLSMGGEPDLACLIRQALGPKRVACPLLLAPGMMEMRELTDFDALQPDSRGILSPPPEAPLVSPDQLDLILVPGLAFDQTGGRLGRGAGYYDRWLPRSRGFKAGIAFPFQMVENVPMEAHDQPMDAVWVSPMP